MNVTTVTERVRALFGMDHAALDAAVAAAPVGCGGMVFLPYLSGERTPNVPDGSGALLGLNEGSFTAEHWARAAMEGVTLGMNYGLRRLAAMGIRAREIRVTGGGARSAAWRRIMADVFGVSVVAMVEDEGAALGAALQAAWCAARQSGRSRARIADFTTGVAVADESTRCKPDPANAARYREMQAVQDELSLALRGLFAKQRKFAARPGVNSPAAAS
jgi:xylulokinase